VGMCNLTIHHGHQPMWLPLNTVCQMTYSLRLTLQRGR